MRHLLFSLVLAGLAGPLMADDETPVTIFPNVADKAKAPEVLEGEDFVLKMTIRNPYDRAIRITKPIEPSCACSDFGIGSYFLLPHEETSVWMTSPTDNLSGPCSGKMWLIPTDVSLDTLDVVASWVVKPKVSVDLIPPDSTVFDQRPERQLYRDIYRYQSAERPDAQAQLVKNILISCPEDQIPDDGLTVAVTGDSAYWVFTTKVLDRSKILLLARSKNKRGEGDMTTGCEDLKLTVTTNHPGKRSIVLEFWTVIDPRCGTPEFQDPYKAIKDARAQAAKQAQQKKAATTTAGDGKDAAGGDNHEGRPEVVPATPAGGD